MYLIYSFLLTLGVILSAPYYLWRRRADMRRVRWRERFGFLPESLRQRERRAIWIHAVSVGETLAVAGLVREIQRAFPERKIFLSHVTPAGVAAGESRLPDVAGRFYLPLDWGWAVKRAIDYVQPALLINIETELWPNLLRAAKESGTRVVLVNARLSTRSFRRYKLVGSFMRQVLSNVDWICAQSPTDADRFRELGARADAVSMTGNLKFDAQPPQTGELVGLLSKALGRARRGPILVAASTMPGEEPAVLGAWAQIRARYPAGLLILAPRHPARFDEVARMFAAGRNQYLRRTALEIGEEAAAPQLTTPEVLLLDTIGELGGIFELADLVFMGGSLVPTGGHNILEPAYWSKPIIFGPHMENFRDIARLFLEARAAIQVRDAGELARTALVLLEDEAARRQMGKRAKQVLDREAGATQRVLAHITDLLQAQVPAL